MLLFQIFYFAVLKRKKPEGASSDSDDSVGDLARPSTSKEPNLVPDSSINDCNENDIGKFIGQASMLSTEMKKELLENTWSPSATYDFAEDAKHLKRKFNYSWLETYSPWLAYSRHQKGAFCKYCTLFPPNPNSFRGVLGSFIVRPFCKFKDIHEHCKKHMETHFHKMALEAAKSFLGSVPVDLQLNKYSRGIIEENRKIITSIISCITFCGSHDLALRGKHYGEGILEDLYKLRIDAGDLVLKKHIEHGKKNASYRSIHIQNEIIAICGDVIKADIVKKVKEAEAYSVLADETADISGTEQLSIGLRYFDEEANEVQEMFVGFVELKGLDAKSIAYCIDEFLTKEDLNPADKCVGFGFDGCSTMSGKDGGVQAILRKKYTKALFFHCSSHKLNLVINDLNILPEIRNTMGTTKDIINFFRESVLRRKLVPNIARLCETRWSEKHKTIRVFKENFPVILEALENLSREGNSATRKNAFQLHAAAFKISFILCITLIAKYSALLEPVVNALQSIALDVVKASQHVKRILQLLKSHRDNPERVTDEIIKDATVVAEKVGLEEDITSMPRIVGKQRHRSNHPAESPSEFWKRSLIIPYLDSVITSLETRFAEENTPSFALSKLHPAQMQTMSVENLTETCETIAQFYNLPNIKIEVELWQQFWQNKPNSTDQTVVDILKEAKPFFPDTEKALKILIALPCTTCTVERSFSSLRRLKTWLRSTMSENRLNGLAMMSVHRKLIHGNLQDFNNKVVEKFTMNPRKLYFN